MTGRPTLTQLRWKMRAKLLPSTQFILQHRRLRILRRHEVIGYHHHPLRVEDLLCPHLLHLPEGYGPGDVVSHHQVAPDHDDLTGSNIVGVVEQYLLGERAAQAPPFYPCGFSLS